MPRSAARRPPSARLVRAVTAPYLAGVSAPPPLLTEAAARRVRAIAERQGRPPVLRLAVDGGGCAGFTYKFSLGEPDEGDVTVEVEGATLLIDPISLPLVAGSQVDFVEDLGGSAFRVTNPNAASGCGCGTSFSV